MQSLTEALRVEDARAALQVAMHHGADAAESVRAGYLGLSPFTTFAILGAAVLLGVVLAAALAARAANR